MDQKLELQTVRKTSRPQRRLIALLTTLGVLLSLISATVYIYRPHWRSYISPPFGKDKLIMQVQMPDTWSCGAWMVDPITGVTLTFHEVVPHGLSGWFYEHILGIAVDNWTNDSIIFWLGVPQKGREDLLTMRKSLSDPRFGIRVDLNSICEIQDPVGPVLEYQITDGRTPENIRNVLYIFPENTIANKHANCMVAFYGNKSQFGRVHSTFLEAAKRIHLATVLH